MKKIYTLMLALAGVVGAFAGNDLISDIQLVTKSGSPYIRLQDNFNNETEYVTRRYVVYASTTADENKFVVDTINETYKAKGGSVTYYTDMKQNICKLYRFGSETVRLYVAGFYQAEKNGEFKPFLEENNDNTFFGDVALPAVFSYSGYTMYSSHDNMKVNRFDVEKEQSGAYLCYGVDSATLTVKMFAAKPVTKAQWQKREVKDVKDETTPWSDYGTSFSLTKEQLKGGAVINLAMPTRGEGGFRNQYWRMIVTVEGGQKDTTKECDVFPEYAFELVGPIALSGYGALDLAAGERDTIWKNFDQTITITGSKTAPCMNIPQTSISCSTETVGSGLVNIAQPGKFVTVTTKERKEVTLTFYDEDGTTSLDSKTCDCGSTAVPAVPQKKGYTFDKWVWMWASGYTWTMDQLRAEAFTVDMNFKASYVEGTGLEEILSAMPLGTKAFSILGQPVGKGYRGIVLIDGKKFMVQ